MLWTPFARASELGLREYQRIFKSEPPRHPRDAFGLLFRSSAFDDRSDWAACFGVGKSRNFNTCECTNRRAPLTCVARGDNIMGVDDLYFGVPNRQSAKIDCYEKSGSGSATNRYK
jgi:hypothetical protein